jgi:hypothetical protein
MVDAEGIGGCRNSASSAPQRAVAPPPNRGSTVGRSGLSLQHHSCFGRDAFIFGLSISMRAQKLRAP